MKFEHKTLIAGSIAGALVGLAAAFLYIKANETQIAAVESGEAEQVGEISPGEAMTVGLSLIGLLRQIVTLGQE
ncbi:MAG: hypothetical protein ISS56_08370 [Anaerolineae bacterium]|jgi:hypothetical protein|nr:hypothetical protein [Anaerolineae bacterium]